MYILSGQKSKPSERKIITNSGRGKRCNREWHKIVSRQSDVTTRLAFFDSVAVIARSLTVEDSLLSWCREGKIGSYGHLMHAIRRYAETPGNKSIHALTGPRIRFAGLEGY
jgi:hypothetical protein